MLYYGNYRNIQSQCIIYNFTSFTEGYPRLDMLIAPNSLGASTEYEFDQKYADYILSDNVRFSQFFNMINLLYSGRDIYLIVSDDDWSENLIESLLKLIQQRYGVNAVKVNCMEDVFSSDKTEFNPSYGLINYDTDNDRNTYIVESMRLAQGGKVGEGA